MSIIVDPQTHEILDADLGGVQFLELLAHRGGCRCQHPPYNPPCNNCTSPLTVEEVQDLGWLYHFGAKERPSAPPAQPASHADIWKAVRDICR